MRRTILVPYTFVLMNWAAVVGLYHFLRQGRDLYKNVWAMHSPHTHVHDHR
jgi:hypothetical protein